MPRQSSEQIVNTFVKGLFTEATPLNFPEGTASETFNCIFDRTGKVTRRKGIDYESSFSTNTEARDDANIVVFKWENVAGEGDATFVVTQIGRYLIFYNEDSTNALSVGHKSFEVDLDTYKSGSIDPRTAKCQFAALNGDLFVVNPHIDPIYIRYDSTGDSITTTAITIKIRDIEGIDDGFEVEDRPAFGVGDKNHHYNILNQGWYKHAIHTGGAPAIEVLLRWRSLLNTYPSNADVWWVMKNTSNAFDVDARDKFTFASPAPKGHYILDAFNQDRETLRDATDVTVAFGDVIPDVTSGGKRPTAVASYAGRIWYAGVNAQGFSTNIYFTQVVLDETQYPKCYQNNDPTDEDLSDTLDTDGGVINIPEIGTVVALRAVGSSLLIFAENGIWAIQGSGESVGFKATDFNINKISEIRATGSTSFVDTNQALLWWADDGIYTVSVSNQLDDLTVQSVSETTIQSFFDDIPTQSKGNAQGVFNRQDNLIQWIYRSTSDSDVDNQHNFDRILNLNLTTGAFYPWSIGEVASDPAYINGVVSTQVGDNEKFLYLCSELNNGTNWDFTFADETDSTYTDWVTVDSTGIDYSSYFLAGFSLVTQAHRDFQSNYVSFHMLTESDASLQVRGQWDFSNSSSSGKWSTIQQAYNSRANFATSIKRLKIRGEGRALQIYGQSVATKPFSLIGWSMWITDNAQL